MKNSLPYNYYIKSIDIISDEKSLSAEPPSLGI